MTSFVSQENEVEAIIVNLKVLHKLEPYQKLNTKLKHFTISTLGWVPDWARRWYFSQSRESDYQRLQDLYKCTFKLLEKKTNRYILPDLRNSMKGLINLKKTYEGDITFSARMDYLMDSIHKQLPVDETSVTESTLVKRVASYSSSEEETTNEDH